MTTLTSPTSTITTGAKGLSRNLRILIFLGAGGGFGALFDAHSLDVPYFPVIALLLLPFFLIVPRTGREGFGEGFLFGLSANLVGVRWVTVSMEEYGHIPPPLALGGLALFSLYLALYPALFRALSYRLGFWEPVSGFLRPRSLWMGPSLWIVCDAGKDEVLTGFPWNPPGSLLFAHPLLALPATRGSIRRSLRNVPGEQFDKQTGGKTCGSSTRNLRIRSRPGW